MRFGGLFLGHEVGLDHLNDLGKRLGIVNRDLGETLPIEDDGGLLQTENEFAVAEAPQTASGTNPYDPKAAEVALFGLPVPVGIGSGTHNSHGRLAIEVTATGAKSLGQFAKALASTQNGLTAASSGHVNSLQNKIVIG